MKAPDIVFPRNARLFKDIDEAGFKRICECLSAKEVHLLDKDPIIRETDPCDRIGLVVSGAVQLSRHWIGGGRAVLETIPSGGTSGMTYVFRDVKTMGINANAVGETVVILFKTTNITRPCHKVCDAHMQFVRNLLTIFSQTTFALKQKLRILSHRTIRGRLMFFLKVCARRAQSDEFDIPFDRQELADYLCVDRSALSFELSKMRKEGLIESIKHHFKIFDKTCS